MDDVDLHLTGDIRAAGAANNLLAAMIDARSERMMFSTLLRPPTSDIPYQLVIAPHHPDRLGRPAARPGTIDRERFLQAVTWNVFRTLELLPPTFWLRRFQARLTGDPSVMAAQLLRVSLWRPMPLPPIQRIDGARTDVVADVLIETEHAVWTLIATGQDDHVDDERIAQLIDAGAWLAGARQYYCGVIEADTTTDSIGRIVETRYSRSRHSVGLRSATHGPSRPTLAGLGAIRWADLAAILQECHDADSLSAVERALAHNAVAWLRETSCD